MLEERGIVDRSALVSVQAKANDELLECLCCFDAEVMAEDMAACNEGHLFCKECIRRYASPHE
jgi:hypothetical protein